MPSGLSRRNTGEGTAAGTRCKAAGLRRGLDYKALVQKYLHSTETTCGGIWEDRKPEVLKMYRVLARLNAPDLTIFLLCVETDNFSEVARKLKVHRSTITRIYHRIEKQLRDDIKGH